MFKYIKSLFRKRSDCEKQFLKNNGYNYAMTLFAFVISACMDVLLAFMLLFLFNSVSGDSGVDFGKLIVAAALAVTVCVFYIIFRVLKRNFMNRYLKRALAQFKEYVFSKLLGKSISEVTGDTSGRFISAFSNDLNSIEQHYLTGTINIIGSLMSFTGSAIAMIVISWKLGLPVVIAALVCLWVSLWYGKRLVKKENKTADENMTFIGRVKDLISGFIVIKSFKAEKEVQEIFSRENDSLESTKQSRRITSDTVSIFGDVTSIVILGLIFIIGMVLMMTKEANFGVGNLMAFIQLGNYVLHPIKQLGLGISNRRAAIALIDRIAETVETEKVENQSEKTSIDGIGEGIVFNNVGYKYDGVKEALNNINFKFEAGKSYAVVGNSGSGKSTLLKLMLGFYPDYSGSITVNDVEIRDISLESLYDYVSVVQQDVFLFDSTIMNNITMYRDFPEEKVRSAAERAGLSSLIEEKGSDYMCGESGRNLSGGEKQRVSIARCLLRETPVILVDEATAALDTENAFAVINEILNIEGLTRIVVTHGLEERLLSRYDAILVVQNGQLVECGKFEDLMSEKGYFYSLYNVFHI